DGHVTGVQTCALPISSYFLLRRERPHKEVLLSLIWGAPVSLLTASVWYAPILARYGWTFIDQFFIQHHFSRFVSNKYHHPQRFRSEERRVGKESNSAW